MVLLPQWASARPTKDKRTPLQKNYIHRVTLRAEFCVLISEGSPTGSEIVPKNFHYTIRLEIRMTE